MLKNLDNNETLITNVREIKKLDDINFIYEYGERLFSSNLKETVLKILKEEQNRE